MELGLLSEHNSPVVITKVESLEGKALTQVRALHAALWKSTKVLLKKMDLDRKEYDVDNDFDNLADNQVIYVAVVGNDIVGFTSSYLGVDEGWIENVYVSDEYRGKGIGRQLMEATIGAIKASGATSVGLNVVYNNAPARKLYESLGLKPFAINMRAKI